MQQIIVLIMAEILLNTLAATFHFGIDWQNFYCLYSCNEVFSEALLLPKLLQEFRCRWVREPHAQLEGSMPAFNVVVCLPVTVHCVFELIPQNDWKQRFTSFTKTTSTSKPSIFEESLSSFPKPSVVPNASYLLRASVLLSSKHCLRTLLQWLCTVFLSHIHVFKRSFLRNKQYKQPS